MIEPAPILVVGATAIMRTMESDMTSSIRTHTDEQRRRKTRSQHNEYTHLTAEELCERINHLRKRMGYGDTRVSYQGRGWYHRYTSGLSWPFKERRHQVEESLRRFEERERREEAERPAKEEAARLMAKHAAMAKAAPEMLAALRIAEMWCPTDASWAAEVAQVRQAIAKAEGREP